MKRIFALSVVLACLLAAGSGFAQQVYFEGEGYVTPTAKSMAAIDPYLVTEGRVTRQQGSAITVTPLAGDFPHIILMATVRDSDGNPVTGLTRNDFVITEQSTTEGSPVAEEITCFVEFQTGGGLSGGIRFSLVFDLSDSMRGDRFADAKTAAISFLQNCAEDDRGSLVSFSTGGLERIEREVNWIATDANANGSFDIVDAVNALQLPQFGLTAVYDGIAMGIESLREEAAPKAIVVFTDGITNSDKSHSINEIITRANNEGVLVYTIGLGVDPQNLKDIANATGGLYYYAPTAQDMTAVYQNIYNEIVRVSQSQYAICYNTHNPAHDGTTRTVVATAVGTRGTGLYVVNSKPEISRDTPTIALSATPQAAGTDLVIAGTVTDTDAAALGQTLSATLYYRPAGQAVYASVPLNLQDQGEGVFGFSGTIPGASVQASAVEYHLYATDGVQETHAPFVYSTLPYVIPVGGNTPPVISHTPVLSGTANQTVTITAQISDPDDGDGISQAALYYRPHNPYQTTFFLQAALQTVDGVTYSAEIPATQVTTSGIDYFISAWDNTQTRTDHGTSETPHFIQVGNNTYTPPIANAGPDAANDEGDTVTLDGTGTTDPDGGVVFQWVQTGGPAVTLSNENAAQPSFVAPSVGPNGDSLTFELTVYDDSCLYSTDTVTLVVNDTPPDAQFSWGPAPASPDALLTFTDMSTSSPETIVTWAWDFGGMGTSGAQNPQFAFQNAGEYSVTLRVVDSSGAEDTITQIVSVTSQVVPAACTGNCDGDGGCFIENTIDSSTKSVLGIGLFMLFCLLLPCVSKHAGRKNGKFLIFIIPMLIAAMPVTTRAENKANALTLSPMVGYYVFDEDQNIDKDFIAGFGLGYNFNENVSAELMGTYGQFVYHYYDAPTCSCHEDDVDGYTLHLDGLYHFRPDERLVPYLALGVGATVLDFDSFDKESSFMANWGGGLKYFFSENVALRADARHIYVFDDGRNNVAATVGLTFQLPFEKKTPVKKEMAKPEEPKKPVVTPDLPKKKDKTTPELAPITEPKKETKITPAPTPTAAPKVAPTPVPVKKTKREVWVRLRIQFDFDKSVVKPKYHDEIKQVADLLKQHPDVDVVIEGHTCSIGTEAYNQKLSQRRADSVKRYLVNNFDISASRLQTKGYGELEPENDNKTREGRRKNRRVIVVKMIEVEE